LYFGKDFSNRNSISFILYSVGILKRNQRKRNKEDNNALVIDRMKTQIHTLI